MIDTSIYDNIASRTGGDIYIGVVGPVRTGKSTFIKRFMDSLVIPNISGFMKERAIDELPQSAAGRTIMTTEPKFVPEDAIELNIGNSNLNVRLIDCVGYIVPSSLGYIEGDTPRMVMTPWFDEEIPFNMAAEIGTKKVITEHSTIGLVVTTDGSISDIPREEYEEAEERVISELKEINKPFVILLNCIYPDSDHAKELSKELSEKYSVPVVAVNCLEIDEEEISQILYKILCEFPLKEVNIDMPKWISRLDCDHWLRKNIFEKVRDSAKDLSHVRDIEKFASDLQECEYIKYSQIANIDFGKGRALITLTANNNLFYKILSEATGLQIEEEQSLMQSMMELIEAKRQYDKIKSALDEVEATGYGIVMPDIEELRLEEPEIVKQGGKYGVKLSASAPSIHMLKADIVTEISPIVGSEKQSEELVISLLKGFEENPIEIWQSEIFGKSLHSLVNEGLHNKLYRMPADARLKIKETIERIINEGCSGLICILL
jgi:stage IV sporulation protein A